jgi:hypothetical protein
MLALYDYRDNEYQGSSDVKRTILCNPSNKNSRSGTARGVHKCAAPAAGTHIANEVACLWVQCMHPFTCSHWMTAFTGDPQPMSNAHGVISVLLLPRPVVDQTAPLLVMGFACRRGNRQNKDADIITPQDVKTDEDYVGMIIAIKSII